MCHPPLVTFMPFGNAFERLATFECLWLGLVVIMIDWPGASLAYEGLPVVLIKSMDEMNPANASKWAELHGALLNDLPAFRRNFLSGHSWAKRISGWRDRGW